ncbi:NADH dehydrogenase FAD-containing subunit [Bacillus mangrovi]|uniref:NADH dehydrogenase FAD-containing subunit n=1 Tax=Metabacillus mangrovi TaxID=1491830 RepID=A0A7X2S7P6_9BACI|nr:NADH dehydrogenase FAD-containing subunit [Metabacillus mangrovi]MTH55188.1 NADH dehydrogenase FAD-containing subunit [Metabacillus mangrovi]
MKTEWNKFIKNKLTYASFAMLFIIVLCSIYTGVQAYNEEYLLGSNLYKKFPDAIALISPHSYWIGLHNPFFGEFYYFIFPLLVAFPVVDSIFKELHSGTIYYELSRTSRYSYFFKKIWFSFLSSFFLFLIPLLLGIVIFNLVTGQWDFTSYSITYNKLINGQAILADNTYSAEEGVFTNLLTISPYLYILTYYVIGGLYASAYTCLGLAISLFLKNRFLVLFMPFIVYIGCWVGFSAIGLLNWDPFNFLRAAQPVNGITYMPFIIDFILFMFFASIIYLWGARKNEDVLS